MNFTSEGLGLGWLSDYPAVRDFTPEQSKAPEGESRNVPELLAKLDAEEPVDTGVFGLK